MMRWTPVISTAIALWVVVTTVNGAQTMPAEATFEQPSSEPTEEPEKLEKLEKPEVKTYKPLTEAERQYVETFIGCGSEHNIDPALLAGLAAVESTFRTDAVSHAGAQGITQFMPKTAEAMGVDPWNPRSAICGTARYLTKSLQIHGNWPEAIAAYNAGDPAVSRKGIEAAEGSYVIDVQKEWENRK